MTTTYERHEYSAIFPDMQPAEYTALRESIKASGQVHPIIIFRGQVLDGWQRYRVLTELGIEPAVKEFEGDELDALHYVVGANLRRRDLTPDQLAVMAVDVEEWVEARRPKQQALFGVS